MVGLLGSFQQPPVHQPPGETHPKSHTGHRRRVELGGHLVVEWAVEVGQRGIHTHPGDGQGGSRTLLPTAGLGLSPTRLAGTVHRAGLPEHPVNSDCTQDE